MTTSEALRIGIIGAGRMGRRHATCLKDSGEADLVAVYDIDPAVAKTFSEEHGGRAFDDADTMVRPDVIDALILCTPPGFRNEYALPALERGVHVMTEKPLARHMPPGVELTRAAQEAAECGVVACVAHVWRHSAAVQRLIEAFSDRPICLIDGCIYHGRPPEAYLWLRDKEEGGGQILDMTSHIINAIQQLAGNAECLYARATTGLLEDEPGFRNDDAQALTMRYDGGVVANLCNTYSLFHAKHTANVHGLHVHVIGREYHGYWRGTALDIIHPDGIETVEGGPDFDAQLADFVSAVRNRKPEAVRSDITDALRTLSVCLAANESIDTGQAVDLRTYVDQHGASDLWSRPS